MLLGFAVAACRLGYDGLSPAALEDGRSGSSGGTSAPVTDPSNGGLQAGGGAAQNGGDAAATAGDAATSAGMSPGGAAQAGGSAGASTSGTGGSTAGSAGMGGAAAGCADATALEANGSPSVAPPVNCAYPGALICDDFENGQLPYWTVILNAPAVGSLETCLVHRGTHALWARPSGTNNVQVQEQLSPGVGAGELHLRTFAYLPSSTVLPAWTVIYEVWDSPTTWTNKISIDLQADGTMTLNNWTGKGQSKTSLVSPAALLPRDSWTCLELSIVVDKTNGSTQFLIGDTQVISSAGPIATRAKAAFSTVSQGAAAASDSPELYFDDFVVATQHIGCN
jgi:hypothetical protein